MMMIISCFRRAGFSWARVIAVMGGGGALLLLLVLTALSWLGTHSPAWALWLVANTTAGKGHATAGVGMRLNALAARLEGLGARDAADQLRNAEQLFHSMERRSRSAMGLPPAEGPNAVAHYLKEGNEAGMLQRLYQRRLQSESQLQRGLRQEYALFDAMEQQAALLHTRTSASSAGSMKLQPGVISEL